MIFDAEVQQAVDSYQLGLPRVPPAGRSGEMLGRGVGSSLEFQEYRQYVPGDDIRHLDWNAYARSDVLMIRLYRDEISPRTEVLLDGSRSMQVSGAAKPLVAKQLAAMFTQMVGRLGGRPQLLVTEEGPARVIPLEAMHSLHQLPLQGITPLDVQLQRGWVPFKRQSVRIVISDFLFPHDPAALVRRLAGDASALWMIQLLGSFEADPHSLGGRRLLDVETGQELDLMIDTAAIRRYRERLTRLQGELVRACRQAQALFAVVVAEEGLPRLCRDELCAAGILRPG